MSICLVVSEGHPNAEYNILHEIQIKLFKVYNLLSLSENSNSADQHHDEYFVS